MEYVDLVNKIIDAEHSAKEIAREVQERKETLDADLERDVQQMRENYFARARHRIEEVEKTENLGAQQDIENWDQKLEAAMAKVELAYQRNREQWVDVLFSRIVGGAS